MSYRPDLFSSYIFQKIKNKVSAYILFSIINEGCEAVIDCFSVSRAHETERLISSVSITEVHVLFVLIDL